MLPNVRFALGAAVKRLRCVGSTPSLEARRLLAYVLEREPAWLLAHDEASLDEASLARFHAYVERRAAGEPLAYILGSVGFFGRTFAVTPDVLVPRPETEHLVEAVLEELRGAAVRVADIGTGSGAIAVTLACEMPEARICATDVSREALEVARRNARRLGVSERIAFFEGDLAAPLLPCAPLTCVLANLPYIQSAAVPSPPHPVGYEPRLALDGGVDGLGLYRRLLAQLPPLLAPGASLFFEAAPDTIEPLAALTEEAFPGAHIEIGEDYGGCDRYVAVYLRDFSEI